MCHVQLMNMKTLRDLFIEVELYGDLIYLYQILKGNYDIDNHLFTHPPPPQEEKFTCKIKIL